ncbi:cuticle protein2a [Daphnia sinensis]|uniref:Cuticle protein2a n=1 Tax=Daphnia sinensis TaxID=1820382 RepID=A0AAD5LXK6_9CRUS|nr:cuticle protein2a [Daphnia sinensis]
MKLFLIAALLAVAAAAPSSYKSKEDEYKAITIVSQSDERNLDGSSQWSYAGSDGTTRGESQAQKKFVVTKVDDYGKETKEEVYGNTNQGSSYWISPEGQRFTLTWAADDAGFQPKGDHLPVAPVHEYELPVAPVHEYELPVAPVHIPFNGKGFKIY